MSQKKIPKNHKTPGPMTHANRPEFFCTFQPLSKFSPHFNLFRKCFVVFLFLLCIRKYLLFCCVFLGVYFWRLFGVSVWSVFWEWIFGPKILMRLEMLGWGKPPSPSSSPCH